MIHRRLLELAGAIRPAILALAGLSLLICALHIAFAWGTAQALRALMAEEADLLGSFGFLGVVLLARSAVLWLREWLAAYLGAGVRIRLRARLFGQLNAVPAAERDTGAATATIIDGVDGLEAYYTRYLPQLLTVLVVPAAVVLLVALASPAAGLLLGGAAALAVLAPRAWDARLLKNGRGRWAAFSRLSSDYLESLQHIPLLRSFGATARTGQRLAAQDEELRGRTMRQLRLSLVETALSTMALHLGTVLAVGVALAAVMSGQIQAVGALTVLLLARECFRPIQELGTCWHAGYQGLSAVDGLEDLLSRTPGHAETGSWPHPAQSGRLELEELSFSYPHTRRGLHAVSLHVASGQRLAIIGPSGSGKSTLARLLEREIDPQTGSISLDGVALRDYTAAARARSVVVIAQDPVLFAWTVAENLRLCNPTAGAAELEAAARAAGIHETIRRLPAGYGTVLSENGEQLSGGQRQRLAIARGLLSPAPLLVLDEVTSALDAATEAEVMDAVAEFAGKRTLLLIAHRPSALRHATGWAYFSAGSLLRTGDGALPGADLQARANP
ncbi:ABC transporter ATP-binding protein/permease [Glutamicibacter sp. AOP38-B1-38]|uniref:ABC transporter ATP-binding protein/permease n=1 Tax=Glutamicibacter sp. AOP38-B1-38 TaxID=3457680 RepID=UPI0040348D1F